MSPTFVAKGEKVVQFLGRNERILSSKYPRTRRSTAFSTKQKIPSCWGVVKDPAHMPLCTLHEAQGMVGAVAVGDADADD